ncbi:Ig-like domain-containing protein [Segetibacter koreensis]|uniref:Ig-like domain-containing protein n=1 Tax=Segetibacter koreensis TaxID=398037 RepID=UPI0003727E82|nr:Ig-like domain-containing protein [Segetibacter koreensis]
MPPVVSIVTPADSSTFSPHSKVHIVARAKDPNDRISKVEFYIGKTLIRTEYYYPYTCWWRNVQPGTYTITTKAFDDKGLSATSEPVTVKVTSQDALIVSKRPSSEQSNADLKGLKLYPNPSGDVVTISATGLRVNKPLTIPVISSSGVVMKTIHSNTTNRIIQLKIASLTPGVYTVKLISGNEVMYRQFIKL